MGLRYSLGKGNYNNNNTNLKKLLFLLLLYGTVHAKLAYHVFIYKVIKMIHFEIATSPEP